MKEPPAWLDDAKSALTFGAVLALFCAIGSAAPAAEAGAYTRSR